MIETLAKFTFRVAKLFLFNLKNKFRTATTKILTCGEFTFWKIEILPRNEVNSTRAGKKLNSLKRSEICCGDFVLTHEAKNHPFRSQLSITLSQWTRWQRKSNQIYRDPSESAAEKLRSTTSLSRSSSLKRLSGSVMERDWRDHLIVSKSSCSHNLGRSQMAFFWTNFEP